MIVFETSVVSHYWQRNMDERMGWMDGRVKINSQGREGYSCIDVRLNEREKEASIIPNAKMDRRWNMISAYNVDVLT